MPNRPNDASFGELNSMISIIILVSADVYFISIFLVYRPVHVGDFKFFEIISK